MEIIRRNSDFWEPFEMLKGFQTDLGHVFDFPVLSRGRLDGTFQPDVELQEQEDQFLVRADLPGLRKDDLSISVDRNYVTLKGERKHEKETKKEGYQYSELFYGSFSRAIALPTDIQAEKAKASYRDGVLEITLPKLESAKPKQIDVEIQ